MRKHLSKAGNLENILKPKESLRLGISGGGSSGLHRLLGQVLQMCKVSHKIISYFYLCRKTRLSVCPSVRRIDLFVFLSIFIDRRHARPFSPARFCLSKTKQFLLFKKLFSAPHEHEHTSLAYIAWPGARGLGRGNGIGNGRGGGQGCGAWRHQFSSKAVRYVDQSEKSEDAHAEWKSLQKSKRKCILAHPRH